MSFGFSLPQDGSGDEWTEVNGQVIRTLTRILLFEISVVGEGAYSSPYANLRSCPAQIRSLIKRNEDDDAEDDDSDLDCDGVDADDPRCQDADEDEGDEESDEDDFDERSASYRCQYRCLSCRSAEFAHQNNLQEDDPAIRVVFLGLGDDVCPLLRNDSGTICSNADPLARPLPLSQAELDTTIWSRSLDLLITHIGQHPTLASWQVRPRFNTCCR
jgi:hypothetical protein